VQYIISIDPTVAAGVAKVKDTVCLALAPLPPAPGLTAFPATSVLTVPIADELTVRLLDASWAAWLCWGTKTGVETPIISITATKIVVVRLEKLKILFIFMIFIFY
jgi:hypothetical protein